MEADIMDQYQADVCKKLDRISDGEMERGKESDPFGNKSNLKYVECTENIQ